MSVKQELTERLESDAAYVEARGNIRAAEVASKCGRVGVHLRRAKDTVSRLRREAKREIGIIRQYDQHN